MDTALRLFVPLAAVSLFKREVDAASYQHRRLATGTTLSSYDVWSTQSTCQVCRDCMNTSYSYLCGRLQCQCLDSLEYCTLMIEEIQSDGITFVQLNATDRAFLGPTTLAGKKIIYTYSVVHTYSFPLQCMAYVALHVRQGVMVLIKTTKHR